MSVSYVLLNPSPVVQPKEIKDIRDFLQKARR